VATYQFLQITDGTLTAQFADGAQGATNYKVVDSGWGPQVATLRRSTIGGRGEYNDVVEEMEIAVTGATAAACLANLQTLNQLLDRAERWRRGENYSAVLIEYSPAGATISTTANPMTAAILGRAPGDETTISPPPDFDSQALWGNFWVIQLTMRFLRRGLWQYTDATGGSAATANGTAVAQINITGGAIPLLSPTKIIQTNGILNGAYDPDIMLVSENTFTIENPAFTVAPPWSQVDETANGSLGVVSRYTPSGTTEVSVALGNLAPATGYHQIFAILRNNSATTNFRVRFAGAGATTTIADTDIRSTRPKVIPAQASAAPHWYNFGYVFLDALIDVSFRVTADAASGTLDIDRVIIIDARNPNKYSVISRSGLWGGGAGIVTNSTPITIDHRYTASPSPHVTGSGLSMYVSWEGNAHIQTSASSLFCMLLAVGRSSGSANANFWTNSSGSARTLTNIWSAVRTRGFLIPE